MRGTFRIHFRHAFHIPEEFLLYHGIRAGKGKDPSGKCFDPRHQLVAVKTFAGIVPDTVIQPRYGTAAALPFQAADDVGLPFFIKRQGEGKHFQPLFSAAVAKGDSPCLWQILFQIIFVLFILRLQALFF